MDNITTRRSGLNYLAIIVFALFAMGMMALTGYLGYDATHEDIDGAGEYVGVVLMAGLVVVILSLVYNYIRIAPRIRVTKDSIRFSRQTYAWTELQNITFTGLQPNKYLFMPYWEGAVLTFTNGATKYILDDMYTNAWRVKLFIQQVVINKSNYSELPAVEITKADIEKEHFESFKRNPLFSFRGLFFWLPALLLCLAAIAVSLKHAIEIAALLFLWWRINAPGQYYFKASENLLVVKNYLFLKGRVYRLEDIKELVFTSNGRGPSDLRVITKDFKSKLFTCGTLRDKTLLRLKDKLDSGKITIRSRGFY